MSLKVVITGFGPFPGAPWNPTGPLAIRLSKLRRPAFAELELSTVIFPVSYAAVDAGLPLLLSSARPDVLLMFGLATRTPFLRIETRARNAITPLWPDASHQKGSQRRIAEGGPADLRFGDGDRLLLEAARATGIDARLSRDAGRYLCNYLSWRAIAAIARSGEPTVTRFIHVPLVGREAGQRRPAPSHVSHIQFEQLVDAGEAILFTMVQMARRRRLRS